MKRIVILPTHTRFFVFEGDVDRAYYYPPDGAFSCDTEEEATDHAASLVANSTSDTRLPITTVDAEEKVVALERILAAKRRQERRQDRSYEHSNRRFSRSP